MGGRPLAALSLSHALSLSLQYGAELQKKGNARRVGLGGERLGNNVSILTVRKFEMWGHIGVPVSHSGGKGLL